jgi:hypothetical protein
MIYAPRRPETDHVGAAESSPSSLGQSARTVLPNPPAAIPPRSFAVGLLLVLLFLLYSRSSDLVEMLVPGVSYIVRTLAILLLIFVVLTGAMRQAFSSIAFKYLTAFTVWLVLAVPMSYWRGGSIKILTDQWLKAYLLMMAACALISTTSQVRKAIVAITLGTLQLAVIALLLGSRGRLQLETGLAGNPNDLAFFVLIGIPGCILMARGETFVSRWLGRIGIAVLGIVALKTGSRMGLIIIAAVLVTQFFRTSMSGKAKLIFSVLVISTIGISFTPDSILDRYRTLWADVPQKDADSSEVARAMGSSSARREELMRSLEVTLRHPLLGVGPGEFGDYLGQYRELRQAKIAFHQTHNTYTQISSEAGIPALVFYLAALVYTIRISYRLSRPRRDLPGPTSVVLAADSLFLAAIIYAVGGFFGSYAYNFFFPMFAAITGALEQTAQKEPSQLRSILGQTLLR